MSKKHGLGRIIANNLFLLKIAIREASSYTIHAMLIITADNIVSFFEGTYFILLTISAISREKSFTGVLIYLVILFIVANIKQSLYNYYGYYAGEINKQKISRRMNMELYKKAAGMDLKCYDDPNFYNDFVWAMSEASTRIFSVIQSTDRALGSIVGILIFGGFIFSQDPIGIIFILISFFGIMIAGNIRNKSNLRLKEETKPIERKRDYLTRVMYLADYAKEIRLNKIKGKLFNNFDDSVNEIQTVVKKRSFPLIIADFISGYVFNVLLMDGIYVIHLLHEALVQKNISWAVMAALYHSCNELRHRLFSLSKSLPEFQEHSLYIEKIRSFLSYENTIVSPKKPVRRFKKATPC